MWYSNKIDEKVIDYTKPIISDSNGFTYILLPQIEEGSYKVVGYNWFDIINGKYNSCVFFETPQEACTYCYSNARNMEIILK